MVKRHHLADVPVLEYYPGLENCQSVTAVVCVYRSSEQKRRFQQQYPDSPSDVIDDAMRRHWESLGDRDRHRYLQRARSAMAVERGRQLGRRGLSQHSARGWTLSLLVHGLKCVAFQ